VKKFIVVGRAADDPSATPTPSVAPQGVAVLQQSATLHPPPFRGGGVAGAAVAGRQESHPDPMHDQSGVTVPAGTKRRHSATGMILAPGETRDEPIPGWEDLH
jgi:hypothetical protein